MFKKVAIVGVGLIGGSIGLVLKNKKLANKVIGVSRHRQTLLLAKHRRAIDSGAQDLNIIRGADLVILAAPPSTILNLAPKIRGIIEKECIVMDVASTKAEIVEKLEKIFKHYVGSHPLCGSEKRGIKNADSAIFKDSLCILTPTRNTDKADLLKMKRFWDAIGARVAFLSPDIHDKILAFVSHLPHVVAFSLIGIMPKKYLRFASGGLRDTTRIAASESELWADILLNNKKNILKSLGLFKNNLECIENALKNKDKKLLGRILKEAKKKRDKLNYITL